MRKSSSASSFGSDGCWNYTKKKIRQKPMKFKIEYYEKVEEMDENNDSDESDNFKRVRKTSFDSGSKMVFEADSIQIKYI